MNKSVLKIWALGLTVGLILTDVQANESQNYTPSSDQRSQPEQYRTPNEYTAANGRGYSNQGYFYNQDQNQTYFYQQGPSEDTPWDEGDRQRVRQRSLRRQQNLQQQNQNFDQQYYYNQKNSSKQSGN